MTTNLPPLPLATAMRALADLLDANALTESALDDILETMIFESDNSTDPAYDDFARFAQNLINDRA